MAVHHLFRQQKLPVTLEEAWSFFSDPNNLEVITPKDMGFRVKSLSGPRALHAGQIIIYKVKPLAGIPVNWVTEITHAEPPTFFVDEQRRGPYMLWHHKHYLEPIEGGVLMTDSIHYKVHYGWLGRLINHFIVERKLNRIFDYRARKVAQLFGSVQ
jgi:ligand-binding SRPBCC domain-containing protein